MFNINNNLFRKKETTTTTNNNDHIDNHGNKNKLSKRVFYFPFTPAVVPVPISPKVESCGYYIFMSMCYILYHKIVRIYLQFVRLKLLNVDH